jgi:hypothetical protein
MEEYRVYRESYVDSNNQIIESKLISSFKDMTNALNRLKELVKEDNDDFADEHYYISLYEKYENNGNIWTLNMDFGKKHLGPKTAKGIFKQLGEL